MSNIWQQFKQYLASEYPDHFTAKDRGPHSQNRYPVADFVGGGGAMGIASPIRGSASALLRKPTDLPAASELKAVLDEVRHHFTQPGPAEQAEMIWNLKSNQPVVIQGGGSKTAGRGAWDKLVAEANSVKEPKTYSYTNSAQDKWWDNRLLNEAKYGRDIIPKGEAVPEESRMLLSEYLGIPEPKNSFNAAGVLDKLDPEKVKQFIKFHKEQLSYPLPWKPIP